MRLNKYLVVVGLLCIGAWLGCKDEDKSEKDGTVTADGSAQTDGTTPVGDQGTTTGDQGTLPGGDGPITPQGDGHVAKLDQGAVPKQDVVVTPTAPGQICTQTNRTCPAGQTCAFLTAWNAAKGTCLRDLGTCSSGIDPRCQVTGKNYSVMCGDYNWTSGSTHIETQLCFLLCSLNGQNYDCPTGHKCQVVNGLNACVPE